MQITRVDANQLQTSWAVDDLGRVTVEATPDQTQKRVKLADCQGTCPNGATVAQVTEFFNGASRIAPSQIAYLDSAGHPVRTTTWGFDGRTVVADQRFDALGRLYEVDYPRFENESAYLAKRLGYDNFNRVTTTTTVDTGGAERTATTTYAGLDITQKNLNGQERKETHDAIGQLVQVLDSNSPVRGLTQFAHDAFGNLSKTTDPNGNVIAITYDLLGRRTLLNDPDLGRIAYGVDPTGRTWSQESPNHRAKGRKAYTEFDLLGRMVGRYEPDLESHWIFDTASTGVGQLAEAYTLTAAGKDYRRVLNYDALGRPSGTAQTLKDATYTSRVDYDDWGRPATATYQRGADAQKIFSTRYNAFGYVSRVERGSLVLWQALGQDASSRPYSIALGNGLVQSKVFNVHTGRLDKGDVSAGGVARVQEGYDYDAIGNVTTRSQAWDSGGFMETLHYDALNRLDSSKIGNSAKIFSYDLAGNIQSKTGTGIYTYPAQGSTTVRPHAVSTVTPPGGAAGQFGYDDNGNLTSGSTFGTWTSFDMPIRLTKGSVWADFTYGPEHQRTSQHRSDGSWVYYAGAQEVDTAGGTTVKTYWPNGIGVEIDRGTSATELSWTHVDRLSSPIALTNETGGIREKLEYDVWGKRRDTLDNNSTPDSIDGKTDNRGFTGHEMLDNLDLIHMNGRIYNPLIGRFLTGDPLISDPTSGHGYNRFSYVKNNPTNLTDPTGFCDLTLGSNICGASPGAGYSCTGSCGGNYGGTTADGEKQVSGNQGAGTATARPAFNNNSSNTPIRAGSPEAEGCGEADSCIIHIGNRIYPSIKYNGDISAFITAITLAPAKKSFAQVGHEYNVELHKSIAHGYLDSGRVESQSADMLLLALGGASLLGDAAAAMRAGEIISEAGAPEAVIGKNPLMEALSNAQPIGKRPGVAMTTLDDGTRVIFRKDFGDNAHTLGGPFQGLGKIDHYNIEIQSASGRIIENIHAVPQGTNGFTYWGRDGVVK